MGATAAGAAGARKLRGAERRLLLVLGAPTSTMAFSATIVSAYLPVLARRMTSSTVIIGSIILGEGLMAMFVPLLSGAWSDRVRREGGSRLMFVLAGAPLSFGAMAALAFARAPVALALLVAAFFAGNFFSYEPYRALYPDLLERGVVGRAQATQAIWRGLGTVLALAGGGLLLSVWLGLPFAAAALLQISSVALLALVLPRVSRRSRRRRRRPRASDLEFDARELLATLSRLLRDPRLRLYLAANALWELSLGALKTFVVLYVTVGLGHSLTSASLIVGAVAVVILLGALVSGLLADRLGPIRTMRVGVWLYGVSLIVPALTTSTAALLASVAD